MRRGVGDILEAIGKGELTPEEGNMIGALIERRANLFHSLEVQEELKLLKEQIVALKPKQPPTLRVVE